MTTESNGPQGAANEWMRQVVDGLFEAEKRWLELASQQNELVLKTMREMMSLYRGAPNPQAGDWARQGLESFFEAQRKWVENITQQQATFMSAQREAIENMQAARSEAGQTAAPTNFTQQPNEYVAQATRRWLDFAAQQNVQFLKAVREGMGLGDSQPAQRASEWAQQAVEGYVEVQKRWLNMASQWTFPFAPPRNTRDQ